MSEDYETEGTEKRKSVRFEPKGPPPRLIANLKGDPYPAKVRNISAGGISILTSRPVQLDTVIEVSLFNKSRNFDCTVPLRAIYLIDSPEGTYILGGAFTRELSDEEVRGLL
jgi:hypothetical protein